MLYRRRALRKVAWARCVRADSISRLNEADRGCADAGQMGIECGRQVELGRDVRRQAELQAWTYGCRRMDQSLL